MHPTLTRLLAATGFTLAAMNAQAAVSVAIGEPGFYGAVDIGGAPPPSLIYQQSMIAGPAIIGPPPAPLYLRVTPGHERNWGRYCGYYHACGRPVYFVQDRWYRETYVPHYHRYHGGPPPGYVRREERREAIRREERREERHEEWRERHR